MTKAYRVLATCGFLAVTVSACGGSSSNTEASSSATTVSPANWVNESCPLQAWEFDSPKKVVMQAPLVAGADVTAPEDKPRIWNYDEVQNIATPVGMVDSLVCWTRENSSKQIKIEYNGEDIYIQKLLTPDGEKWVTAPDQSIYFNTAYYPDKDSIEEFWEQASKAFENYDIAVDYVNIEETAIPSGPTPTAACQVISCGG